VSTRNLVQRAPAPIACWILGEYPTLGAPADHHAPAVLFAVLIITPDDVVSSRDIEAQAPRDNVMFELGLFMGRLGRA
jgi:hypothetical protein